MVIKLKAPEKQRARNEADKRGRKDSILRSALKLFEVSCFQDIKMSEVARGAGLAKGTVFLYYPTKEALFLSLLEERLDQWLADLGGALARKPGPWSAARLAEVISSSISRHSHLMRLLALLTGVLESNVDEGRILEFKSRLLERLQAAGALLEDKAKGAWPAGQGIRTLLRAHALAVGLQQVCGSSPRARKIPERPGLEALRIDFVTELRASLEALFSGLTAHGRKK